MCQGHLEVGPDPPRIAAQHDDPVGQQHGFFDVMRYEKNRLGRDRLVLPQLQEFTAQVLGRQHIERREGLIHEQHFGFDHQRPGEADPLPHAA